MSRSRIFHLRLRAFLVRWEGEGRGRRPPRPTGTPFSPPLIRVRSDLTFPSTFPYLITRSRKLSERWRFPRSRSRCAGISIRVEEFGKVSVRVSELSQLRVEVFSYFGNGITLNFLPLLSPVSFFLFIFRNGAGRYFLFYTRAWQQFVLI